MDLILKMVIILYFQIKFARAVAELLNQAVIVKKLKQLLFSLFPMNCTNSGVRVNSKSPHSIFLVVFSLAEEIIV